MDETEKNPLGDAYGQINRLMEEFADNEDFAVGWNVGAAATLVNLIILSADEPKEVHDFLKKAGTSIAVDAINALKGEE